MFGSSPQDAIDYYLNAIEKVPLLTPFEEIELGYEVKNMRKLLDIPEKDLSSDQLDLIKNGQKARARMFAANIRLLVSVAKKYQDRGLELLDLVKAGSNGLDQSLDKFDPDSGYKFATYAYWWIREGIKRALNKNDPFTCLPSRMSKKLAKMHRITKELTHRFGREPNRLELSFALGIEPKDFDLMIAETTLYKSVNESLDQ